MKFKHLILSLCLLGSVAFAQNTKISALPAGAPAQANDQFPAARSGSNVSLKVSDIISFLGVANVDALYSGTGKCYLFKGTSPGSNDGCDVPSGSMVYPGAGFANSTG